jgi:hypothetical protein
MILSYLYINALVYIKFTDNNRGRGVMRYRKVVFFSLLAVGLGLCIGGVFVPPLAPIGGSVLLAAAGVGIDRNRQDEPASPSHPQPSSEENLSPESSDSLSLDFHVGLHHGQHLHHRGSLDVSLSDAKEQPAIEHQRSNDNKKQPHRHHH